MTSTENGTKNFAAEPKEASEIKYDLQQFCSERILSINSNRKTICVLGKFKDLSADENAILILEKSSFKEDEILNATPDKNIFNFVKSLENLFVNDIYGNFTLQAEPKANPIKLTIIYPASEKHVLKYTNQNIFIIEETAEQYKNITESYLTKGQLSLDWVYNILEHKQETDRIVFEDPDTSNGFILLPDLKWDGKTKETLYLIAITHRRDILTLRDLNSSHLDLLRNLREKGYQAIEERYDIKRSQIRAYVHYMPSFYHFHVHFTYLKFDAPGTNAERSHLLANIISNIELMGDYYQKATLPFTVRESDHLCEKYEEIIDASSVHVSSNKKLRVE